MSKVSITRSLLDDLATSISAKSGEVLPLTLDEMKDAVDGIQTGGGSTLITKNITQNGTYSAQDDSADGYSSVTVAVPSSTPTLQTKSVSYTPTETAQSETVTADNGYDGLDEVNVSVEAISNTYVGTGITRLSAQTIYPSTSDQTINSGRYLTGNQTIKAVTTSNLTAANIKSGVTVTVGDSADADRVASVTGTYTGGGGSGGLTLLSTTSLGTLSISSTTATDTGKSLSLTGYGTYDLLIVDVSVDTPVNGRHTSTVSMILLTGTSNVNTKNTYTVASNKWNSKLGSTGTGSTRQSTTAYGIYANSATVSSSTMTIPLYYRYNSNSTGTLNGTYTARIYGVKLYDLIGG